MSKFIFLLSLFTSAATVAYTLPNDFWENCPGPACPGNMPELPINNGYMEDDNQINMLLEIENQLLKKEIRKIMGTGYFNLDNYSKNKRKIMGTGYFNLDNYSKNKK